MDPIDHLSEEDEPPAAPCLVRHMDPIDQEEPPAPLVIPPPSPSPPPSPPSPFVDKGKGKLHKSDRVGLFSLPGRMSLILGGYTPSKTIFFLMAIDFSGCSTPYV